MRAYFWGNMYMSSIQQGIQSLHCLSEMYQKYTDSIVNTEQREALFEWGLTYKTVIVLNAGEMSALEKVESLIESIDNPSYAWASWRESADAMNCALTSVGIILPERMYKAAQEKKKYWRNWENRQKLSPWEIELVDLMNSTYMAR